MTTIPAVPVCFNVYMLLCLASAMIASTMKMTAIVEIRSIATMGQ